MERLKHLCVGLLCFSSFTFAVAMAVSGDAYIPAVIGAVISGFAIMIIQYLEK